MPEIHVRFLENSTPTRFGPLEFEAIGATAGLKSDGYSLSMLGADISRLTSGRAALLADHGEIIGKILSARTTVNDLRFRARFASPGVSHLADEKRRLLKDGIINSCSLSFTIQERQKIPGGHLAVKWTALEISLTAVPIDADAIVTARSARPRAPQLAMQDALLALRDDLAQACERVSDAMAVPRPDADFDFRQRELDVLTLAVPPDERADSDWRQRQLDALELAAVTWPPPHR